MRPGSSIRTCAILSAWPPFAPTVKAAEASRLKSDPARRFVRDNIRALIDRKGSFQYLALYNMDFNASSRRAAFMKRVTRAFESW